MHTYSRKIHDLAAVDASTLLMAFIGSSTASARLSKSLLCAGMTKAVRDSKLLA
jgi:hypothetical protein